MYILIEGLKVFTPHFLNIYIQNNIEYLMYNMIHQVIEILYSILELILNLLFLYEFSIFSCLAYVET